MTKEVGTKKWRGSVVRRGMRGRRVRKKDTYYVRINLH